MSDPRSATAVRFDADVYQRLKSEADERMVSMTWIVNRLVREGLDRLVPVSEFRLTRPKENPDE